jgi:hypothetical protein
MIINYWTATQSWQCQCNVKHHHVKRSSTCFICRRRKIIFGRETFPLVSVPKDKLEVFLFQNVSKNQQTATDFIGKRVKINQVFFCFQQDFAWSHKQERFQLWVEENLLDELACLITLVFGPQCRPVVYSTSMLFTVHFICLFNVTNIHYSELQLCD